MTARVIFINTLYWPDMEERARLENLQEYLTYCHAEYEYSRRDQGEDFRRARKNEVHKMARRGLKIVPSAIEPTLEPGNDNENNE